MRWTVRRAARTTLLLALLCVPAAVASPQKPAQAPPAAPGAGPDERSWSGNLQTNLYLQEDDDFLMPILRADRGSLHLEGRFQYEDRQTGSAWVGWSFATGKTLRLELVPMAGVIFGRTNGLAPGLELTLAWRSLELYSEGEYVVDFEGAEGDYFYNWSELSWQALPWLRLGLATQRTRMYRSELEIERGVFAALSKGSVEVSLYGFNLDGEAPFVVVALGIDF